MNQRLLQAIEKLSPADEATDAEVLSALSASPGENKDTTLYSFRHLTQVFGIDVTNGVLQAFQAAAQQSGNVVLSMTLNALANNGIDFSAPETQGMITLLQGQKVFTEEQATALKRIGIRPLPSILDTFNLSDVKEEEIAEARQYRKVKTALVNLYNTAHPLSLTGELTLENFDPLVEEVRKYLK